MTGAKCRTGIANLHYCMVINLVLFPFTVETIFYLFLCVLVFWVFFQCSHLHNKIYDYELVCTMLTVTMCNTAESISEYIYLSSRATVWDGLRPFLLLNLFVKILVKLVVQTKKVH